MKMVGKGVQKLAPELDMLRYHRILGKRHHKQPEMTDDLLYAVGDHANSVMLKNKAIPMDAQDVYDLLAGSMAKALEEKLGEKADSHTCEVCTDILMKNKPQFETVCLLSGFHPYERQIDDDSRYFMPPITEFMFVKMARRKMEMKYHMDLKSGVLQILGNHERFSLLNERQGVVGFVKYKPNNARYSDHLALHVNSAVWHMNNYELYHDVTIEKFVVIGEGYESCRMYDAMYGDILADQKVSIYLLSRAKGLRRVN